MVLNIKTTSKMKKEEINKILRKEIRPENTQGLREIYEKVYRCTKCNIEYGSDLKKEQIPYLCPRCSLTKTNPKKA